MKKFKDLKDYKPKEKEGLVISTQYFYDHYIVKKIYRYEKVPQLGLIMRNISLHYIVYETILSKQNPDLQEHLLKILWRKVSKNEYMAFL